MLESNSLTVLEEERTWSGCTDRYVTNNGMFNFMGETPCKNRMKEDEPNLWIKKLLDAPHLDIWAAISYMCRYPSIGIQQYICDKIRYHRPPINLLPQLVHIFLYGNGSTVSQPMYNLFKFWAYRSQRFSCALYFHLRSALDSSGGRRSVSCYFLICDLFEIDRKKTSRNTRILSLQYKYRRRLGRTLGIPNSRHGSPFFRGIFLFFAKAVSWPIHPVLFTKLSNYEKILLRSDNAHNINFKTDFGSGNAFIGYNMRVNVSFLRSLVEISGRLKKLPKHLRQRGLEMEIRLLNHNLPARLDIPFHNSKFVLTARIEESFPLDSAENSPFLVVFETADKPGDSSRCVTEELKNASFLVQQLNAVSGLSSLGEIDTIKENVMESIEKILMMERHEDYERTTFASKNEADVNAGGSEDTTEKKETGKHLDDTSVGRKIFKQHGGHELFLMADRSYSAGQLTHESHTEASEGNDGESKDAAGNARQSAESNGNAGYRHHDSWMLKRAELKKISLFKNLEGWSIASIIVKTGSSLKQEIIAYQLLTEMKRIWKEENKPIWVHGYQIYLVNDTSGIVETVTDAISIHKIKKKMMSENKSYFLKNHFVEAFGLNTARYKKSVQNFLYSLVGYSLATYLLQVKDRHNGNIMIDGQGHVVHVDFGFILGLYPGFYCVEGAPFKFSKEYFDLLEDLIDEFKMLFLEGYMALRKHSERLCRIIEIVSEGSAAGCFNKKELGNFRDRLKLDLNDKEVEEHVLYLINKSFNNVGTGLYDSYQYLSYGYL